MLPVLSRAQFTSSCDRDWFCGIIRLWWGLFLSFFFLPGSSTGEIPESWGLNVLSKHSSLPQNSGWTMTAWFLYASLFFQRRIKGVCVCVLKAHLMLKHASVHTIVRIKTEVDTHLLNSYSSRVLTEPLTSLNSSDAWESGLFRQTSNSAVHFLSSPCSVELVGCMYR